MSHAILLISCPDRKGITATVTNFVYQNNGNIVHADQHIDTSGNYSKTSRGVILSASEGHPQVGNTFFMRIEWDLKNFRLNRAKIRGHFAKIARKFGMTWELYFTDQKVRTAIFVSRHLHCLYDLLLRHRQGQLSCEIPLIISNHSDAKAVASDFGIKFMQVPITPLNKSAQEKKEIKVLKQAMVDLIVLARYHQVLTRAFVQTFSNKIINIHHSFLPAFAGKNPYLQAFKRGVKIIGATSHFVSEELDAGPIIEQDVAHISHRNSLEDLVQQGEDLEKMVLSRAVKLFLQHKILTYGNKTVIFD
ncbi:MAG: formyltetrahydrofolate deformylase [Omnitrophica WOR_2 bacterium GWA2_47_8]|nr:MAG: formyltetrahydrofolate deformylase [Omnitrophica WOR_2 bacterium GWA2_47_8]